MNNHVNLTMPDPEDPDLLRESDANRKIRQKQLFSQIDADARESKRHAKLDHYFSQHPPNGPTISIYRDALATFVLSNGETPKWLTYPQIFASFERLEKLHVLKIEMTVDKFNVRHYASISAAKRRNVRPAEINALVLQLKENLPPLQQPHPSGGVVHGCRYVSAINKWCVSLFIGGRQRALGCYPFETAIRLQDVLTFHFSPYRQSASYNTSAEHAAELLVCHPALVTFCVGLEEHWLLTGVLQKPGVDKTEERWKAIETRIALLEAKITA